ncbi:hypothetical protein H5410_041158 [Solanum commersonii]|uniref:Uncharacterized protein n=1 Tax=Solanum commersonii TaxID=4109 RepID=A0A9J5XTP5_SOLCO|nr:hypothetical protein H5410_041158 [Solanum commersonii]
MKSCKSFENFLKEKIVVEEPESDSEIKLMVDIDNYQNNSVDASDNIESSEGKVITRRVVEILVEMRMIPYPCQFLHEISLTLFIYFSFYGFQVWIYEVFPHLEKYAEKSLDTPLPISHLLRWHTSKSDNIVEGDPFKYKGRSMKVYIYLLLSNNIFKLANIV